MDLHHIDKQPKEATVCLLRIIAYHDRLAGRADDKDLEESQRYHEASRKDAEELLAIYEKRWPEEAAVGKSEYAAAETANAGSHPSHGAVAVIARETVVVGGSSDSPRPRIHKLATQPSAKPTRTGI